MSTNNLTFEAALPLRLQVTLKHPIKVVSVVLGGFYPPFLAQGFAHVVDRNVISRLEALPGAPDSDSSDAIEWNLAMLNRQGVTLNPVLSAAESNVMAPPDPQTFHENLLRADNVLKTKLSNATIVSWSSGNVQTVYDTFANTHPRTLREMEMLMQLAPALVVIRRQDRRHLEDQVAKMLGIVPKPSPIFVYALLSLIYGGRYARGVLKPKEATSPAGAYNALSDLRHFEFFLLGSALALPPPLAFTTMDKALAALAVGMRAENLSLSESDGTIQFRCRCVINSDHFPRLPTADMDRVRALLEN